MYLLSGCNTFREKKIKISMQTYSTSEKISGFGKHANKMSCHRDSSELSVE